MASLQNATRNGSVSCKTFHIAGILTDVYGLDELLPQCTSISCLWLLHPRLQAREWNAKVAQKAVNYWNERPEDEKKVGLIATSFDMRNHGNRMVSSNANDTWKEGNETHAQDMYSILHGSVVDLSLLIDHLESYIFHSRPTPLIHEHLVLGVSLGGHGAWQALFNEPRITSAVAVIGCPDYLELLRDRAKHQNRDSYTASNGDTFANSIDFPPALVASLSRTDPKALLFSSSSIPKNTSSMSPNDKSAIISKIVPRVKNKRILVQFGARDKLVPYDCSKPFLDFLKDVESKKGWFMDSEPLSIDERMYENVGHRFADEMLDDAVKWIAGIVGRNDRGMQPVWLEKERNTAGEISTLSHL